jgi:hypothetical protein
LSLIEVLQTGCSEGRTKLLCCGRKKIFRIRHFVPMSCHGGSHDPNKEQRGVGRKQRTQRLVEAIDANGHPDGDTELAGR